MRLDEGARVNQRQPELNRKCNVSIGRTCVTGPVKCLGDKHTNVTCARLPVVIDAVDDIMGHFGVL